MDPQAENKKSISIPRILTREDEEMFQNDSYESQFESHEENEQD